MEKIHIKYFCLLSLLCALPVAVSGQQSDNELSRALSTTAVSGTVSEVATLTSEDYANLQLPPLQVLLENAKKVPIVQLYETRKEVEIRELKSTRRFWTNYFRITGSYQYGVTSYYPVYDDPNLPPVQGGADQARGFWGVGGTISLPLFEIFNRNNKIKQQEARVRGAELEVAQWEDEQSLKIIDAYTIALQNLAVIKTQAEAVTIATAQYKVTEADFINGKCDAQTLSRQKNIQAQTIGVYEQIRAALNNALLKLEVLSKTKIISR